MRVEVDMSDFTMGGMLLMKCENEKQRLVVYISKSLNKAEKNYEIHNKEILVIIQCLEAWKHFLEGAKDYFEIWTDYKNLEYFIKVQKLNRRQARQALYLSRFDFTLKHVADKSMGRADSLSRRVDYAKGIERNNKNQIILKKEWLEIKAIEKRQLLIEGTEEEIIEKIKKSEAKNDKVINTIKKMKKVGVKVLKNKEQQIEDDLVLKKRKVYVLRDNKLRLEIIWFHHNMLIAGHREQ